MILKNHGATYCIKNGLIVLHVVKEKSVDHAVEKMLLKEQKEGVAQLVQRVKITKDEQVKGVNQSEEKKVLLV